MNKLRIFKSMGAIALMGTMTLTGLTGCKKEEKSFLNGTDLEDSNVISFEDGHKDVAVIDGISCHKMGCDCGNKMYRSIITNEYFADDDCKATKYYKDVFGLNKRILNHYNIINNESIVSFLTPEEIAKAAKGELTEEDVIVIVNRALGNTEENKKVK